MGIRRPDTVEVGDLRERVTLQSRNPTSDSQGGRSVAWTTLATTWASVEPLTGDERLAGQAVSAQVGYHVTIRYRPSITPRVRVLWGSVVLQIHAVINLGGARDRFLQLECGVTE